MRIALVAACAADSGQDGSALAAALAGANEVELFGERKCAALLPRDFDRVLYWVRGSAAEGFIAPLVRALGGTVALDAWNLGPLAFAVYPELAGGGLAGFARAVREGGLAEAREYRRLARGGCAVAPAGLALNRSIVRFADAFVVPSEALARRVLDDRNAPTPIAVVERDPAVRSDWNSLAPRLAEWLERFPPPRTARKPLVSLRLARAWQRGREGARPGR